MTLKEWDITEEDCPVEREEIRKRLQECYSGRKNGGYTPRRKQQYCMDQINMHKEIGAQQF